MNHRSTAEVFESHLQLRVAGKLDEDLQQNYADAVTLLCDFGVLQGREAIRQSAHRLALQLPDAHFEFTTKQVDGEYALLLWKAASATHCVEQGVDSFVIRNGRIVMQTIYYRLANEPTVP